PCWLVVQLAILGGTIAGALSAGTAGVLITFFDTCEAIVTIMLNYVAICISDHIIRNVITDRADATPYVGENASLRLQWLTDLTNGSTIHGGIFLALIFAVLVSILLQRTTVGFELRSVGFNKHAANYEGMNV